LDKTLSNGCAYAQPYDLYESPTVKAHVMEKMVAMGRDSFFTESRGFKR
jgi:hypothetical protein